MYHLDYLAQQTAKKRYANHAWHFLKEAKTIIIIGAVAFLGVTIFTNAQLFAQRFTTEVVGEEVNTGNMLPAYIDNSISTVIDQQLQQEERIATLVNQYSGLALQDKEIAPDTHEIMEEKINEYDFSFTTLPPTNRLLVPKFGVDDPIVDSKYTSMDEFVYKNYNEDLKNGVVKYPTTPEPGQSGNTLIFGHTSQERWKYNKFGMAFAHIAELQQGDEVQVVWKGNLYKYKVVDIQVKYPQHVNDTYRQYANLNKNYLTLMGCYPIGTAKQRILVIAELQE